MEICRLRENRQIQILISDEFPVYGEALRVLLERQPGLRVVGVARDSTETVKLSQERMPEILILSVRESGSALAESNAMRVLAKLEESKIELLPLLIASSLSGPDLIHALLLGVRGVVLEKSTPEMLVAGIRGIIAGQFWIGEQIGRSVTEILKEHARSRNPGVPKRVFGLTPREFQIIETVIAGCSNAEIARQYALSPQTVKHHLSNIFDKIGVFNRIELALFAVRHHLVSD